MRIFLLFLPFLLLRQILFDVVDVFRRAEANVFMNIGKVFDANIVELTAGLTAFVVAQILNEKRIKKG